MRSTPSVIAVLLVAASATAADPTPAQLEQDYRDTVRPFLQTYCVGCHGGEKPKADLDLSTYPTADAVAKDHRRWELVLEQLKAGAMPPTKAKAQPTADERKKVLEWVRAARWHEAKRTAGDPGPVPARRLSNAEYDHTVRDLTGVDLRPTKEFPVDPANKAGFDNSAESLAMSPALVKKYLAAARQVADHLVLTLDGIAFAPHPVVTDTDRDKYVVRRVIDFYKRQPTDYADYFLAAWKFQHRAALGKPNATLADTAADARVSAKYLTTIWAVLTEPTEGAGPVAAVQAIFRELPKPPADARPGCEKMRDFVVGLRQQLVPEVKNLTAPGMNNGAQPLVMWKNYQFVANRMRYAGGAAKVQPEGVPPDSAAAKALAVPAGPKEFKRFEATFDRFCKVFPDTFYVSERARVYLDPVKEKKLGGRLLSAGFHSMTGYFRDDSPLFELILDAKGQQELDRLWREFNFINGAPIRQYTSFVWFERTDSRYMRDPEFDAFRAEDKDVTSTEKIHQLLDVYLAKAKRTGASETAQEAITGFFADILGAIRVVETDRRDAEPAHLRAVQAFAERAYRRPLSAAERDDLVAFYQSLREKDGLTHEEAVRDVLAGVLMSPHFCYRLDPTPPEGKGVRPLSDYALASRLSYFLWASTPDAELLARAASGDLHKPEVLAAQVRRMLRDEKVRGLATEFGGNWLDFRRFEEHNSVDRGRFPAFNDDLRRAMFEEPLRFLVDLAQRDRSVLDFLYADHTFVNAPLARHYGMPEPTGWARVDGVGKYGRGGLLPMAVFLTKNSPGLRTSPVKRGYWVVRRVLGETIPAPPATVPELPDDETKLGNLTLRETLGRHRADASCASCHNRFDSVGVVFEGYGPVGERRTKDLGGRPVETQATFPGGGEGVGLDGLRAYIREHRQDEFVENLCRKLLAYALGRSLLLSDEVLVQELKAKLAANGYRFGVLVEEIVRSPQFGNRRGNGD